MIALLKEKDGNFYCSNCRMRVKLQPHCEFCGYTFSDFESKLLAYYDIVLEDEIKNEKGIQV